MSEPSLERLSRFTPDAGDLQRDALLFAAGRASARPNRAWIALAMALAGSQVLSLALLWPRPMPPAASLPTTVASRPGPPVEPESPPIASSDSPGLWSARPSLLELQPEDLPAPAGDGTLVDSGPPLRAFGPPPSILN